MKTKRLSADEIKLLAKGRELEILEELAGIPKEFLDGKHHPCPWCGGTDRFRLIDPPKGSVFCNQCFNEKNGDFLAAVMKYREVGFPDAIRMCGDWLAKKPANRKNRCDNNLRPASDPPRRFNPDFLEYDPERVRPWLATKGISEDAFRAFGGILLGCGKYVRIGIPGFRADATDFSIPDRLVIYAENGAMIQTQSGEAKSIVRKLTEDSPKSLLGLETLHNTPTTEIVWKTEGATDAMALWDAMTEEERQIHVVISNVNGAKEKPSPETITLLQGRKIYIVGDADVPGQIGAENWRKALLESAEEVRVVTLPYSLTENHGKDLRDFFADGNTFADLCCLVEQTVTVSADEDIGDISSSEDISCRLALVYGMHLFSGFAQDVLCGNPPPVWRIDKNADSPLNRFEMRPGMLIVVGGAPGEGKSALIGQATYSALKLDPSLKLLLCNVEMSPQALLERLMAYQSGIDLFRIINRDRQQEDVQTLQAGLDSIKESINRTAFTQSPFSLDRVLKNIKAFDPDIVVLDYVQRIRTESNFSGSASRERITEIMDSAREIADGDRKRCVIVVSALSRPANGSKNAANRGITSFRESSELEYSADACWILDTPSYYDARFKVKPVSIEQRILRCLKNRYGKKTDIPLYFDGAHQRFTPTEIIPADLDDDHNDNSEGESDSDRDTEVPAFAV